MTEKRFECDKGSRIIIDNETKLHYIMTLDWECSLVTKLLNRFADENEQLKQAVRELLEEYGNSYYIEIMDKLFNLDYDKWDSLTDWDKRCPYDWEKMIKGDVE